MAANDYDDLIRDPSSYFQRTYLPRVLGALGPWSMLGPWTDIIELPFVALAMIQPGFLLYNRLLKPSWKPADYHGMDFCRGANRRCIHGRSRIANTIGGFTKAPFDTLGIPCAAHAASCWICTANLTRCWLPWNGLFYCH